MENYPKDCTSPGIIGGPRPTNTRLSKPPHETAISVNMIPGVKRKGLCGILVQRKASHQAQKPCHKPNR